MMLETQGVRKTYRQAESKIEVLRGIDLKVARGSMVSIVGPSGGGKSTLLSILSGVDRPTEGKVIVDGKDLTSFGDDEMTVFRGRAFGIVFQQFHLIAHLNALENVMLPMEISKIPGAREKAEVYLNEVGLGGRYYHRPSQLSGGETQRVAIARALAPHPQILLADEPSGNLDSKTGQQVMDLLFNLVQKQQSTLILVTHSKELAGRCQFRYGLEDGCLQEI